MSHRLSAPRPLLLSIAVLSALAIGAPAFAQSTTAPHSVNVVELEYAPSSSLQGLDLRAGRYLLELRGPAAGPYDGLLRGPNNEIVDAQLVVTRSGCSGTALPSSAVLQTQPATARPHINPVALRVVGATGGGCQLHATINVLGLTSKGHTEGPACELPEEISIESEQGPPVCMVVPTPPLPIAGPLPDLKPGSQFSLGGQSSSWNGHIQLSSSFASFKSQGRCYFNYSHRIHNIGLGAAGASTSAVLINSSYGPRLDDSSVPALPAGANHFVNGLIGLPPGIWKVFVHADIDDQVNEVHGANNARSLFVTVSGNCASSLVSP